MEEDSSSIYSSVSESPVDKKFITSEQLFQFDKVEEKQTSQKKNKVLRFTFAAEVHNALLQRAFSKWTSFSHCLILEIIERTTK